MREGEVCYVRGDNRREIRGSERKESREVRGNKGEELGAVRGN